MKKQEQNYNLGIVGARGYVGKELLALVNQHPHLSISWISSRQLEGQPASTLVKGLNDLNIESLSAKQVAARKTDIVVLALPNGLAQPFVEALESSAQSKVIIDLSADYRFDSNWIYSLPELDFKSFNRKNNQLIKISNPGCYATAMQLALAPIVDLITGITNCFGVSGYSGAGTKPNPNNLPKNLKDNLIGYQLIDHLHEKEVTCRLKKQIHFSPHVAEFFRGINLTIQVEFNQPQTQTVLLKRFESFYRSAPLVNCCEEIPTIQQVTNTTSALIGGFSVSANGMRAGFVCCLDNLLKGAASQALQNINLALGLAPEFAIPNKIQVEN